MVKKEKGLNLPELYYHILKECVDDPYITTEKLGNKLGISSNHSSFSYMESLGFLAINKMNFRISLLPEGFSTYLSISSQKQSSKQARKAIYFAVWALVVSIASFIASIIFSIIS